MRALIFDCETTGGNPDEVIELGWGEVGGNLPSSLSLLLSDFCQRYQPIGPITPVAMSVHHIVDSDLAGMPPSSEAILPECEYIVGHNVDFDWEMVGKPDVKRICTLAIARQLYPEAGCHRLGALAYMLFGPSVREAVKLCHSAMDDVRLTTRVLQEMLTQRATHISTMEALWDLSEDARIPKIMPFGKHKGMPMSEVPRDYKQWLLRQDDVDPYLAKALQQ